MISKTNLRCMMTAIAATMSIMIAAASPKVAIPSFPWENDGQVSKPSYLYMEGGFLTTEKGCPDWGTSNPSLIQFIGDNLGQVVITYSDGKEETVPLVIGYTIWIHGIWMENPAPFKGDHAEPEYSQLIQSSLSLKGGFEGSERGVLRIALSGKDVKSIRVEGNKDKDAKAVFVSGWFDDEATDDDFFKAHTVKAGTGVPSDVKASLKTICKALHTFESDFKGKLLPFEKADRADIRFNGTQFAKIATGVLQTNITNLRERTDDDGMIHTSYKDAPSWRYDGFGPYIIAANSYYDAFYSRDAARAIMSLNGYNDVQKAVAACLFGNKWMMYYPENGLTLGGKIIPGHYSVMPNKPLIYSQLLTKIGVPALCDDPDGGQGAWPTKYTKKRFGDEYENLGNQETDGHGLMMMANWLTWKNAGATPEYVKENWTYIEEAAKWIEWCFENPELSFVKDNMLYGETEAAMNAYTLYANVPCYLGMICYAEMAAAAEKTEIARKWIGYAELIRKGIDEGLTVDGKTKWDGKHFGFYHDPVPAMLSDVYGYDTADMPSDWIARSVASFDEDLEKTTKFGWFGPSGIGYNHSMMTQNALLLDRMDAGGKLLESLSKISYAPRLPEPYLVPEGMSIDAANGIYRRQGDLGNLVQLAEALKCYLLAIGISPVKDNVLKIMPRLPEKWTVDVTDFPVQNTDATITLSVGRPKGSRQSISYSLSSEEGIDEISVRFGPFKPGRENAKVKLNGKKYTIALEDSGDSSWGWVTVR